MFIKKRKQVDKFLITGEHLNHPDCNVSCVMKTEIGVSIKKDIYTLTKSGKVTRKPIIKAGDVLVAELRLYTKTLREGYSTVHTPVVDLVVVKNSFMYTLMTETRESGIDTLAFELVDLTPLVDCYLALCRKEFLRITSYETCSSNIAMVV